MPTGHGALQVTTGGMLTGLIAASSRVQAPGIGAVNGSRDPSAGQERASGVALENHNTTVVARAIHSIASRRGRR